MRGECPEPNQPGCPYAPDCFASTHHKVWERRSYRTPLEKRYRELPENKEQLCRFLHDSLHISESPPLKPSVQEMRAAVSGIAIEEWDNDAA